MKKLLSMILVFTLFFSSLTTWAMPQESIEDVKKVLVTFNREVNLPIKSNISYLDLNDNLKANTILQENESWTFNSLFNQTSREILSDSSINFNFYEIIVPASDLDRLISYLDSSEYVESFQVNDAKLVSFGTLDTEFIIADDESPLNSEEVNLAVNQNPLFMQQSHLQSAPVGTGWVDVMKYPGVSGTGVAVSIFDQGFLLNHEDLVNQPLTMMPGVTIYDYGHGTMALGVVAMENNYVGGVGMAYDLRQVYLSTWYDDWSNNFVEVMSILEPGDIINLQGVLYREGHGHVPAEDIDAFFYLILEATNRGIIVIQPAGNTGNNLDTYVNHQGKYIFNRNSPDFRDSGSIVVGAVESHKHGSTYREKASFSTWGSRVDVFGPGWDVVTTMANPNNPGQTNLYTTGFNGTSSASAVITGVIASWQGHFYYNFGTKMSPAIVRTLLSEVTDGTPVFHEGVRVGTMPDMYELINFWF